MQQLSTLVRQAQTGIDALVLNEDEQEVNRVMQICNACRYCEGFCAVFPAMTHRLDFTKDDINYLANLCHNCGACLHSCQYAAPHEFAVNVPRAMARVRMNTYVEYAWPARLGALYKRAGLTTALAVGAGLALFLILVLIINGSLWHAPLAGNFYAIFPHNTLVLMFGAVFGFAVLALAIGGVRFWRTISPPQSLKNTSVAVASVAEATQDVLTLRYLGGGHGEGCNNEDDRFTLWRRRFHHLTFYGFMFCFAATSTATIYHYFLAWPAPYSVMSVPVIFGIIGGVGLFIGPVGLLWMNIKRHPEHGDAAQKPMDRGFIVLLFLTGLTGLALLLLRDTGGMALALAIHLGFVMAMFLMMPYGKFAHGVYRAVALLKYSVEKRQMG
jgi:citrate/tricarballylate utilization protein